MENTKIYTIVRSSGFMLGNSVVGFTFSEESAEYHVWSLNRRTDKGEYLYNYSYYITQEVPYVEVQKGKDFEKFLKEKKDKILSEISDAEKCKDKDNMKIETLKESLKKYETN